MTTHSKCVQHSIVHCKYCAEQGISRTYPTRLKLCTLWPILEDSTYPLKKVPRTAKALRLYPTFRLTGRPVPGLCLVVEDLLLVSQRQGLHYSKSHGLHVSTWPSAPKERLQTVDLHSSWGTLNFGNPRLLQWAAFAAPLAYRPFAVPPASPEPQRQLTPCEPGTPRGPQTFL